MADPTVIALREAATHRGFRLLASRRRKPGTGDFGKFGLADAKGKAILGVGDAGLTATAAEVEAFLRRGELETWKRSADAPGNSRTRSKKSLAQATSPTPKPRRQPSAKASTAAKPARAVKSEKSAPKKRAPPPLRIRPGTADDAAAIATLLGGKRGDIALRLAALRKAGGGILVADRGGIIGCLAFALSPALHRPLSGRIATVLVAERYRREGIGRALVEDASARLARAGCASIEAMSDIEIRSAHGFFRRLGFEETSYRFVRAIARGSER